MNPLLLQYILQRIASSPVGQRATELADAARRFEMRWPAMSRGPAGQFPVRTAADKIPLAPLSRGAAGIGAAGMAVPKSLWGQLNERSAGAATPEVPPREIGPQTPPAQEAAPAREIMYDRPTEEEGRRILQDYPREEEGRRIISPSIVPLPPRRPANLPGAREIPMPPPRPRAVEVARSIFGGPDYQSNSRPVVEDRKVNWGDPESAADFFRAERAAREMGILPAVERASGGQIKGDKPPKDAALTKALEIIHDLLRR